MSSSPQLFGFKHGKKSPCVVTGVAVYRMENLPDAKLPAKWVMENGPRPDMATKWPPKWKDGPQNGIWPVSGVVPANQKKVGSWISRGGMGVRVNARSACACVAGRVNYCQCWDTAAAWWKFELLVLHCCDLSGSDSAWLAISSGNEDALRVDKEKEHNKAKAQANPCKELLLRTLPGILWNLLKDKTLLRTYDKELSRSF